MKPGILIFSLCLLGALTACGIKPGEVSAPAHANPDTFPRTYPNPATDPAP